MHPKIEVGAALTELDNPPPDHEVRGRDLMTGIPKLLPKATESSTLPREEKGEGIITPSTFSALATMPLAP